MAIDLMALRRFRANLDLEILCTIPAKPNWVSSATLVEDWGFNCLDDLRFVLRMIEPKYGIRVRVGRGKNSDKVSVDKEDAKKLAQLCEAYWTFQRGKEAGHIDIGAQFDAHH
jgi:hypothetical protein